MKADGKKYRHCTLWRQIAGRGDACKGMCTDKQKQACYEQQIDDCREAEGQLTDDEIWGGVPTEHQFKVAVRKP